MNDTEQKPKVPENEFLKKVNQKVAGNRKEHKRRDLLEGYESVNNFEVQLNPYTKMVCTLYEHKEKKGIYKVEQRIGYNRIVYDGNFSFVVAETLRELTKTFVPADLKPQETG